MSREEDKVTPPLRYRPKDFETLLTKELETTEKNRLVQPSEESYADRMERERRESNCDYAVV